MRPMPVDSSRGRSSRCSASPRGVARSFSRFLVAALMMLVLEGCAHSEPAEQAAPVSCPSGIYNGDEQYAPFFERVEQMVHAHWEPKVEAVLRRHDAQGGISSTIRLTVLNISLDGQGLVRDVQVKKGCGAYYLNDAAVAAVRESSPLPPPPSDLLRDGVATLDFGFCVRFGKAKRRFQSQTSQ